MSQLKKSYSCHHSIGLESSGQGGFLMKIGALALAVLAFFK
jgi:hypothetical protein